MDGNLQMTTIAWNIYEANLQCIWGILKMYICRLPQSLLSFDLSRLYVYSSPAKVLIMALS